LPHCLILILSAATVVGVLHGQGGSNAHVDTLQSIGGLPAALANRFREPIGFAETTTGEFLVLDRRAHTVYAVDAAKRQVRTVIQVGYEQGRVIGPGVLSLAANDIFAVSDAPNNVERIQYFSLEGHWLGGFLLERQATPRLIGDVLWLGGVRTMHFTGKMFLVSRPETGWLFEEYDATGAVARHIGALRPTGQESDRGLHLALNAGLPLSDRAGGFYFVFQVGVPAFRKYDAAGALVFERHIEGVELDDDLRMMPTKWLPRAPGSGASPLVPSLVRTAAVDRAGRLWVSLSTNYTYVYAPNGDKVRTVQFRAAGIVSPTSLFFAARDRVLVTPGCYEFSSR
jgi:hypothetical protein